MGEILRNLFHHRGRLARMGKIFANGDELSRILVESADVGLGPADVDADPQFHGEVFCRRSRAVASASTASSGVSTTP
jgi:hypothetical protein